MPKNAKVKIFYGPYIDCFGQFRYEPCRLEGLKQLLETNEHEITVHQMESLDQFEVFVNGENIYQSKVKNLDFSKW